ncbi:hypothetical protein [Spirosoma telluris]
MKTLTSYLVASFPLVLLAKWLHRYEFESLGTDGTTDELYSDLWP